MPKNTLAVIRTKQFKKGYKKIQHKKKVLQELKKVVELLRNGESIPTKYKDYELIGELRGIRELHLGFDDLLLYFIRNEHNELLLVDIGSHARTLGI